jgi:hypothetical protein
VGGSGSFLYDSVQDEFIFVHRGANTTVTSSVVLMGPQTFDKICRETNPTLKKVQKGTGNEQIVDSCIFDNGTTTCIKNNLVGTGTACFIGAATFTGNITVDKSSPNISINAPTGTSGQYNINNGVGSLMWAMYSTTGGGNSQGNFGLYSAGKTGGAGAIIDITPTGAATFSSTLSATTGYFSCNVIIDNQSLNNAKYLQFDANISSGASALLGDIRWYNKQWDSSIKAQIVALTDTDITNGRLSFRTGTDGVNAIERLRISSTGISCFQNTICAPLFTSTNGVVAIGAGPSSTEIFTATGPSSSNGMYLIIYSQQGTPGSATGMAYVNIWNNVSVDVYNIFCQSLSNVTNSGTSIKIQTLSGNGGFTAVYSVIRLR